jgi:hypothetical protein
MNQPFKTCTKCGHVWPERENFLVDPDLRLVGYQVNFENLKAGLFLFNHGCGTTLAIPAEAFTDLHRGPIFHERLKGAPSCPDICLHQDNFKPCPAACECAYVREVLDRVARWPKQPL